MTSIIDKTIEVTYKAVISPFTLTAWAWRAVRPKKEDAHEHDDDCPQFSDIPVVPNTEKIDAAWPPAPHPVEALSVKDLFAANSKLIRELCYASTLSEEEAQRFLLPVITNLASVVHLAPASEYDHHQGYGGLFTHSLEVAYYAAQEAGRSIFDRSVSPKDFQLNKRRWVFTAVLAALCHDVGKVFTDMNITAPDGQHWKQDEPILTWLRKNKIESYYISFRPGRKHNVHKSASLSNSYMIIPKIVFTFLGATGYGDIMHNEFRSALLEGKSGGLVGRILDNSDGLSRMADQLRQRQIRPEFKNVSHPQGDQLLKSMRVLIQHAFWTTNKDQKSRVFNTKQGCFVVWNEDVVKEIREQAHSMGYEGLPSDILKLATVLVDSGAAIRNTDDVSNTHNVFWRITPIVLGNTQVDCIKFSDPNFIFDQVPPSKIESIVEGCAVDDHTKEAWIEKWKFLPVLRMSRQEEIEVGYTEEYINALAEDAEAHLREADEIAAVAMSELYGGEVPPPGGVELPDSDQESQNQPNDTSSVAENADDDFSSVMATVDDDEVKDDSSSESKQGMTAKVVEKPKKPEKIKEKNHAAGDVPSSENFNSDQESATVSASDQEDQNNAGAARKTITTNLSTDDTFNNTFDEAALYPKDADLRPEPAKTPENTASTSMRKTRAKKRKGVDESDFNMAALCGSAVMDDDDETNEKDEKTHPYDALEGQRSEIPTENTKDSSSSTSPASPKVIMTSEDDHVPDQPKDSDSHTEAETPSMDWEFYAEFEGSQPIDDEGFTDVSEVVMDDADYEEIQAQTQTPSSGEGAQGLPVVFFNQPLDENGVPLTTSEKPSSGHLKTKKDIEEGEDDNAEDNTAKTERVNPIREAHRQSEMAMELIETMASQMEHRSGFWISDGVATDVVTGCWCTSANDFIEAVRRMGIDEDLIELAIEDKAALDERPRIEWNRKENRILLLQ